ncbi:MAG: alpha/beta fold hydrolase [Chloroflexi bacterium]|nr:alpha/beta fold hydrolase [Chloroflexota bacterium]
MNEQYIDVNGWRTRYVSAGESGPALVLLHGLGASLESWRLNVEALGKHLRVFAPDLFYFGKSAKPPFNPTHADFVGFVLGFMNALGVPRASLVGNSMGGAIAARTTIHAPERVEHLVLVAPAGFGHEVAWWLRLRALIDVRPRGMPPPWMVRYGLSRVFHKPDHIPAALVDEMVRVNQAPDIFDAYRRVIRTGVNWRGLKPIMLQEIRDCADRIHAPTLIVWGKQDRVLPVKQLEVAREKIPHARTCVFDECGHAPQMEHPDKFNALVREFVGAGA